MLLINFVIAVVVVFLISLIIWLIYTTSVETIQIRKKKQLKEEKSNKASLKIKFSHIAKILEYDFHMRSIHDNENKFNYSKTKKKEELRIGIKLISKNKFLIFSSLKFKDIIIYGTDYEINKPYNFEESLNLLSTIKEKLNLQKQNVQNLTLPKHSNYWNHIINKATDENFLFQHITKLFILDDINPSKFEANLFYKNNGFHLENLETISIREVSYIPPKFSIYFVCAYPDVYLWIRKNFETIEIIKNLQNHSNGHFEKIENQIYLYRELIDQFIKEGYKLECK